MEPKILDLSIREEMAKILSQHLADTYILYLKTQNYHWNIVDPRFYSLHKFFEEHYEELAEALDIIAERIRMIDKIAPATMKEFLELTELKEGNSALDGDEMISDLLNDNISMANKLRNAIHKAAELGDDGTMDMLTDRLKECEKRAWMLKSHLSKKL